MDLKSTTKAALIAPFSSLLVVIGLFAENILTGGNLASVDGLFVIIMFSLGFVATSYVFVICCGVPLHFVLCKLKLNYHWLYVFIGVCVAMAYIYFTQPSEMPAQLALSGIWVYGVTAAVVSFVFWLLAVKPHNKALKQGL
ncbi:MULTISPECIES: hypothetical protein [Pseudoalteromonas]|uniref:Uncharacterized protein n=1 Tax=Pseudoalteromonas amylolytica TaxID=1859457 RepID=A0A1S1ML74_9GAMM|nr:MULTISPECIES: hypothetical protein [Pseudoalteromonas]OHU87018.1 hypothetical protein BFC16_13205 [Pseudoalteromonas sp. JW3]OHU88273.1 hypothetical protein BET10_19555 [Pseudoalteromonas amylolytica]